MTVEVPQSVVHIDRDAIKREEERLCGLFYPFQPRKGKNTQLRTWIRVCEENSGKLIFYFFFFIFYYFLC